MKSIYSLTITNLEEILVKNNFKKFNAKQIFEWLYKKRVHSFQDMSNLSKELRAFLMDNYEMDLIMLKKEEVSLETNKYLFELRDGNLIESVLMKHDYGNSICVSSEVGCNMGCSFCESGRLKKVRDLTADEMVTQILLIESLTNQRIDSVVVMGIGEPFDNYDNVLDFIKIINNDYGISIGARHITVSTCGIVPKIYKFMEEQLQINLALSLHAPNNELRSKLMNINKAYNIEEVMEAIKKYIVKTNRRVTIEYILLDNVNDSLENALELCKLISGLNVYVNLIPYNETSNICFKRSKKVQTMKFYDILKKNNINVTIRREFGKKISAACGQLRASEVQK